MTGLVGVSVPGCRVPMSLLERLSVPRTDVAEVLVDLRRRTGLTQLALLSTCERTEVYAAGADPLDPEALLAALAGNRGLPGRTVRDAATVLVGERAAHHLLRVTAGLESFVLGETDIVGQVRTAAETSRTTGLSGLELDRLMATAVNTSRRVHRHTALGRSGGSVAAAAVRLAATGNGGTLAGQRLLVVGAGHVANEVVGAASRLGATVTVCNRTRRHADRFAAAGATVVDLARLPDALATTDVAIFGTAAPHRLLDATGLARARAGTETGLLVLDLCVPRNVAPDVHDVPGVRLVDLSELRVVAAEASDALTADVAAAESIVAEQLDRYLRWLAGRSAARSVQRLRTDLEACAREELDRVSPDLPQDVRALMEESLRRTVRRLAHGPTRRLLDAAEAGDADLVETLAGLFATIPAGTEHATESVS